MRLLFIHNNNLPLPIMRLIYEPHPLNFSFNVVPISQDSSDRDDYDTFLDKTLFASLNEEYDLIVLPLSLSNINPLEYSGIRCASHIRLDKRYKNTNTPILFIGPNPLEEVLRLSDLGSLLLTPSVFLSNANTVEQFIDWLKDHSAGLEKLNESGYTKFLSRFEVTPPTNFADDHHSVANIWGATVLCSQITKEKMPTTSENGEAFRSLFFKYVFAKREILVGVRVNKPDEQESLAIGKSILLIDDEAEKGWEFALKHYLAGARVFDVISQKLSGYEDIPETYKQKIENGDYDLVFLDLRLNGLDEESILAPEEFSGMKVLQGIKERNRGIQVIMFTASNKAWNLKALLDAGADGYYIKQSPEFYTEQFAEHNFQSLKETVKYCLTRTFLKKIYSKIIELNAICTRSIEEEFYTPIEKYFMQSFILLSSAADSTQYKYAFLSLFGVIEEVVKYWIPPVRRDDRLYFFDQDPVKAWDIDRRNGIIVNRGAAYGDLAIARKILAIYMDAAGGIELERAKHIFNIVTRRHNFVHNSNDPLPFITVDTPELGDRHSYEDLFEVVDLLIRDCFDR